MKPMMWR